MCPTDPPRSMPGLVWVIWPFYRDPGYVSEFWGWVLGCSCVLYPADLALDSIPLLHLCKPCVQVAFGQKVSIVASTGLHVSVPEDPVGKHNGLPRQPMHFIMPVIALALKVVVSTWPAHRSNGAVDEADDECQLARYSALWKCAGAQQRTWNHRGFWQSTGNLSVSFSWVAEQW